MKMSTKIILIGAKMTAKKISALHGSDKQMAGVVINNIVHRNQDWRCPWTSGPNMETLEKMSAPWNEQHTNSEMPPPLEKLTGT
jgi:hypothetical protein